MSEYGHLSFPGMFLLADFFFSDFGSHFVLLCISSNFCIGHWTLHMLHCWIFRFCFLPLMTIEAYFRRQLSYLQIGSILPKLVLLSVRIVIEQPLIYSNFRPMSKAWLPVKSIGIQWGLFTLVGNNMNDSWPSVSPGNRSAYRFLAVILCPNRWISISFTHMEISISQKNNTYQTSSVYKVQSALASQSSYLCFFNSMWWIPLGPPCHAVIWKFHLGKNSRVIVLPTSSHLLRIVVLCCYCQCLKTVVLYILSSFLVVYGRRASLMLVTLS